MNGADVGGWPLSAPSSWPDENRMTMVIDYGVNLDAMEETSIQASVFKARCLALLDEVARTGSSIVVTKHGRPVAKLVPLGDGAAPTFGSVTLIAADDEEYFSTGEAWDAGR